MITVTITEKHLDDSILARSVNPKSTTLCHCVYAQALKEKIPFFYAVAVYGIDILTRNNAYQTYNADKVSVLITHWDSFEYNECRAMLPMTVQVKDARNDWTL